ncbi:uncharacterized protein IL334_002282 [Kwoniella shivajii]|uniref:protein-histidine N-methyltransferase n=1 Tax=Kwoniella shivajii TaxID=564305 RepID=A0ABZ1CVJ5_9TREE|nr:hypothetical protein IL334_002282 [Kwoniella shivajii]
MFKFDFQLDDEEEDESLHILIHSQSSKATNSALPLSSDDNVDKRCHHITLEELIKSLPEEISYSPLSLPFIQTPILRRDLYDARFQLYNKPNDENSASKEGGENEDDGEKYVDAQTDLIPGLYEGGLKSWEGGVDLVEVLSSVGDNQSEEKVGEWIRGASVLEVGCGTSLPTHYLLRSLLSTPSSSSSSSSSIKTTFHVQDYNSLVLSLVTLPNLVLAALPFLKPEVLHAPQDEEDVEDVIPDLESPGNLALSPALVEAFQNLLVERGIDLKFTYGHWTGLADDLVKDGKGYDLVLTAETIYAEESNASLLEVLRSGARKGDKGNAKESIGLEDSLGDLKVNDDDWQKKPLSESAQGLTLVAAKVLYFGVGGGLSAFLDRVENDGGWWKGVKNWTKGVGRKVVQVGW